MPSRALRNMLLMGGRKSILSRPSCVFWTKAKGSGGVLVDGTGRHAIQHGSAAGADSNDPLFLGLGSNGQYCYFPGSASNYASSPDSAATSITGTIDLQVWCAPDDWTPGASSVLIAKFLSAGNQRSYQFFVNTSGTLSLSISADGTAVTSATSSVATGLADGSAKWVRATWRQSDGRVQFFLSDDGSIWTQLGTDQTIALAAIFDSTALQEIGASIGGTANFLAGKFYRARIYSGFSDAVGTLVFDANFATAAEPFSTFTESSANAATVTINRSATGRKSTVVDRDQYLLGVDDYFEVPDTDELDFALSDNFTVAAVVRAYGSQSGILVDKRDYGGANAGWYYQIDTANRLSANIHDGTNSVSKTTSTAYTDGVLFQAALRRDVTADVIELFRDGTSLGTAADTTTATLANALPMRIGRGGGSQTDYVAASFVGLAVFREPLTAADLALVKAALLQ